MISCLHLLKKRSSKNSTPDPPRRTRFNNLENEEKRNTLTTRRILQVVINTYVRICAILNVNK